MALVSRNKTLKFPVDCLNNQQGSALIIVLILMAVLTLVGLSAINTATVENKIVGNERIYQENFYLAESAVLESLQALEAETNAALDGTTPVWLTKKDDNLDMGDSGNWDTTNSLDSAFLPTTATATYAVVQTVCPGYSVSHTDDDDRLYCYIARGRNESNNGRVMIEMGYKKRH